MIHDEKFFESSEFVRRAEKFGFPQPLFIELLAWDYELAAQLQAEDARLVLKGGAAVQLFLPVEMQRVSVDIDLLCPSNAGVKKTVERVEKKLEGVKFTRYTPKKPVVNLPMLTFLALFSSRFSGRQSQVKIDLLMEDLDLPTKSFARAETIALTVKRIKCFTLGTLLGDKLQVLADAERVHYRNFPKHVYDVSALIDSPHLNEESMLEAKTALEKIVPAECRYKRSECDVETVLLDAVKFLEHYSRSDLRIGLNELKRQAQNFTQVYTPASQRVSSWKWSCKTLKTKFFASIMLGLVKQETNEREAYKSLQRVLEAEQKLDSVKPSEARPQLTKLFTARHPGYKEIRNAALPRLFWQVAQPGNIDEIEEIIKSKK